MAATAKDGRLRAGIERHLKEMQHQVARLERLGYDEAAQLLRQTLDEEQLIDTKLNDLAKNYINQKAM